MFKTIGQSLIELLLAMGLTAILLPALITGLVASREGKAQQNVRLDAVSFFKETNEAIRNVREKNWSTFAQNGTFYPHIAPDNSWELIATTTGETINGLTRKIDIEGVYRDNTGKIVPTGIPDPSTKKITVNIAWSLPILSQINSSYYLTRFLDNASDIWTTENDFNFGTKTGIAVRPSTGGPPGDGEVVLGAGGSGSWCAPNLALAQLDLPKNGTARAISAVEGHVSVGTGENASGTSYAHVTVSNTNPPIPSVDGTFDGYKTNDIWADANYAYLATDNNAKEVVILDISHVPYQEVGYFNTPFSSADATSVYVQGNRGYVTAGLFLYIFDLTSKTGSRPLLGLPFFVLGTGTSVVVKGNYAYVSIASSPIEMQIIDISNPWNIFQSGYADVNGQDGKRIFVNDTATRAYLVTNASSTLREFFIIDTSSKTGSRPIISSYDANGMNPQSLSVVTGNRAIIVGTDGEEYQVIDISSESNPVRCGGLNVDVGINGISSVLEQDGDAYSYIITGDANSELKIIEGGPGGQYASSGSFESNTFQPVGGYNRAFNRFDATVSRPTTTDIRFQVAVEEGISGSCTGVNYTYVGPGGDTNLFFETTATGGVTQSFSYPIPFGTYGTNYKNPGLCFRYKTYLSTTDISMTPVLYDFTVNYSP